MILNDEISCGGKIVKMPVGQYLKRWTVARSDMSGWRRAVSPRLKVDVWKRRARHSVVGALTVPATHDFNQSLPIPGVIHQQQQHHSHQEQQQQQRCHIC